MSRKTPAEYQKQFLEALDRFSIVCDIMNSLTISGRGRRNTCAFFKCTICCCVSTGTLPFSAATHVSEAHVEAHVEAAQDVSSCDKLPVGVGKQVNTVRRQSGQAGKHARDLNTKMAHSVSSPGSRNEQRSLPVSRQEPRQDRPHEQEQGFGRCFGSRYSLTHSLTHSLRSSRVESSRVESCR